MTGVIKVDDIQDAGANSIVSSNGSGTLTLGSFTAPNITASTAILPDASDGAAIGSASLEWSDLFLADGAVINLGDDQDVTLTHVADTGIQLNSTNKLMFNDASQYIQGASATVLDIAATDEIELTATLVDINANVEISGTAVTTGVHTFTAVPVFPNNTVESADIQADAITAAKIADNAVVTAGINADAVTGAKIADDAINSEHYTDGSIDTAHIADLQVTSGKIAAGLLGGTIAFRAHNGSTTQNISNGTTTQVNLGTESFDIGGNFANSTFTVPSGGAGKYVLTCAVRADASWAATDNLIVRMYVGANDDLGGGASNNIPAAHGGSVNIQTIANLADGDTVKMYVYHDEGGTEGLQTGPANTFMSGVRIGA
jgi:hypothetical protein